MLTWVQERIDTLRARVAAYTGPALIGIEALAKSSNDPKAMQYWRDRLTLEEATRALAEIAQTTRVLPDGMQEITPHVRHLCSETCQGCPLCQGHLFMCDVCQLAEGALTTDCCGRAVGAFLSDAIYAGDIDYQNGQWVKGSGTLPRHPHLVEPPTAVVGQEQAA